jgi:glycosyltransferase involved in cell wall biosynthesis
MRHYLSLMMLNRNEINVSVCCITYNHNQFIAQAIESFLIQNTDFNFEIIIGEDCSIDGTREIVFNYSQMYSDKIKIVTSENNVGAIANELRTLQACKGKYIAFCEGDDFWADPFKLQKQVDFLEANPDFGLVHGDVNHLNQETGEIIEAYNKTKNITIPQGAIFNELLKPSHLVKTMTVCFRRELFEKYYLQDKEIMSKDWRLIDISIWLVLAHYAKFHYFDEVLATYRLLPESLSRTKDPVKLYEFHQKIRAIFEYFAEQYHACDEIITLLKEHFYRADLTDAYNIRNKQLSKEAFNYLKIKGAKISPKEKLLFYATNYSLVRKIKSFFKSR